MREIRTLLCKNGTQTSAHSGTVLTYLWLRALFRRVPQDVTELNYPRFYLQRIRNTLLINKYFYIGNRCPQILKTLHPAPVLNEIRILSSVNLKKIYNDCGHKYNSNSKKCECESF